MPAVEAIGEDPQELRRGLRDLVAVSMLPAIWRDYDAREIAESVTEVLIRMLGLEFAYMSVRWERDRRPVGGAHQEPHRARSDRGDPGGARRSGSVDTPTTSSRSPTRSAPARSGWRSIRSPPARPR